MSDEHVSPGVARIRRFRNLVAAALLLVLPACVELPLENASADDVIVGVHPVLGDGSPGAPRFDRVLSFSALVTNVGRPTDVYVPLFDRNQRPTPLPVAIVLQGALVDRRHYSRFARTLAAQGFVVAVPEGGHAFGLGPFIDLADVRPVLDWLRSESARVDSPLAGVVETNRLVLVGHSFGGAAALDAARDVCAFPFCSEPPTWRENLMGVAVYAADLADPRRPGAVPLVDNGRVAVIIIAGDRDGLADLRDAAATFDRVQDSPAAFVTVRGAAHYSITDAENLPEALDDPGAATLDQLVATETIARWTGTLLRALALRDPDAIEYVTTSGPPADSNVDVVIRQ